MQQSSNPILSEQGKRTAQKAELSLKGAFYSLISIPQQNVQKQNTDFLDKPPRNMWESKLLFPSSTVNLLEAKRTVCI